MWYVIQVISGQEQSILEYIRRFVPKDLIKECFCPTRERSIKYQGTWNNVIEKLFPGYVFVVTEDPQEVFLLLRKIPRFTKLLGDDENTFIPLTEEEIAFIQSFGDEKHESHLSQVQVEEGNRVVVMSGDLKNYEGKIVKINLHKRIAVVRTEFMGAAVDVHLGIEILEKKE